jgi:uncharacterized OB-fold protein
MADEEPGSRTAKPLPTPSPESRPFWQAARDHQLALPRCNRCEKLWFPPAGICPHCLSDDTGWQQVSGRGRVYSFVVFHRAYHPAFELPYVVAVVELDEGPRLLSNIVDVEPQRIRCGMHVVVKFEDRSPELSVPKFSPAETQI